MPTISLIVVNYNGKATVLECLEAIGGQSCAALELIIVDNHSTDGSFEEIEKFFRDGPVKYPVKLISLDRNTGFAGGNIEGLKHASGEYIALLNNDARPRPGWLDELVFAMESHPEAGICASTLVCNGSDIIDSAGDGFSTIMKGFKRAEGQSACSPGAQEYIFGACAGAALYRRKMIDEIGFLDEDFFLIHEDTDLNFRAQLAGWKVLFVPAAVVDHDVSRSVGKMSGTAVYYALRNSELVKIKNIPSVVFVAMLPQFVIGEIAEFLYFVVKHGRFGLYVRAKVSVMKLLPRMLEKRRTIMKMRKVKNRYIISMMTPAFRGDFFRMKIRKFMRA